MNTHSKNKFSWLLALLAPAGLACTAAQPGGSGDSPEGSTDTMSGDPDAGCSACGAPQQVIIKVYPDGFPYTGRTENAPLVAFQDGDGPWAAVTGFGGVYRVNTTTGRFGVAVGCAAAVSIYYQTAADGLEVAALGCRTALPDPVHVAVDVQGVAPGEIPLVWLGGVEGVASGSSLTINVPRGLVDSFLLTTTVSNGSVVPLRMRRGPSLNVQLDQSLSLDLSTSVAPQVVPVSLTNRDPAESVRVVSSHRTRHSQVNWPVGVRSAGLVDSDSYFALPSSVRQADDLTTLFVAASQSASGGRTVFREVGTTLAAPGPLALDLPTAPLLVDDPVLDTAAVPRVALALPVAPVALPATMHTDEYIVNFSTQRPLGSNSVATQLYSIHLLSSWVGSRTSVAAVTPELEGLPGWTTDMALTSGSPVSWSVDRIDANVPHAGHLGGELVDGGLRTDVVVQGQIQP